MRPWHQWIRRSSLLRLQVNSLLELHEIEEQLHQQLCAAHEVLEESSTR